MKWHMAYVCLTLDVVNIHVSLQVLGSHVQRKTRFVLQSVWTRIPIAVGPDRSVDATHCVHSMEIVVWTTGQTAAMALHFVHIILPPDTKTISAVLRRLRTTHILETKDTSLLINALLIGPLAW